MGAETGTGRGPVEQVMMSCIDERRRFERVEENVCTWLSFRWPGAAYSTLTNDLGPEGAQFALDQSVNIGEHIMVNLDLPTGAIECKGKVCWFDRNEGGRCTFGVRFVDLSPGERDRIGHYLSSRHPLEAMAVH